jgi:hypothetical protein
MCVIMDTPATFIGKVVLVEAETTDGSVEKLRVRVDGIIDTHGGLLLHGRITRSPQYATYLKQGDRVEFTLDEIEQV